MSKNTYLQKIEEYYVAGRKLLDEEEFGESYFYQVLINKELKRLYDEKQLNVISYNHYRKHYKIDKRKK